MKEWTAEQRV